MPEMMTTTVPFSEQVDCGSGIMKLNLQHSATGRVTRFAVSGCS